MPADCSGWFHMACQALSPVNTAPRCCCPLLRSCATVVSSAGSSSTEPKASLGGGRGSSYCPSFVISNTDFSLINTKLAVRHRDFNCTLCLGWAVTDRAVTPSSFAPGWRGAGGAVSRAIAHLERNRSLERACTSSGLSDPPLSEQRAGPDRTLEGWWDFVKFSPTRNTTAVLQRGGFGACSI